MGKITRAILPAVALAAIGVSLAAQNIRAPVQIVDASSTIPEGNGRFPLSQIRDGLTTDNGRNGFVGRRDALGTISFRLDQPYDIDQFHIWNDVNVRAEGVENFALLFYSGGQLVHSQEFSGRFAARAGVVEAQTFSLSKTATRIDRVDLRIDSILERSNTFAKQVEIREVAFSGVPSGEAELAPDDKAATFGPLVMRDRAISEFEPNMVLFFSREPVPSLKTIAADNGLLIRQITELEQIGLTMVSARIEPGDLVEDAIARLQAYEIVEWAEPNAYYQLLGNSRNDGLAMHGLNASAPGHTNGGTGKRLPGDATIVLIDSPVDTANAALQGARIEQIAVDVANAPSPHGTAIAELLVGSGDFPGVAQGARLVSFAAFEESQENGFLSTSETLAKALNAASAMRPHAVNLSFGSDYDSKVLSNLLNIMDGRGICIAAAAGNGDGAPVLFPARHASTLAVTAIDRSRKVYAYASVGDAIDVAAWGVAMNTAVPGGRRVVSGTSFANALVSGAMLYMPACTNGRDPAAMRNAVKADAQDLGVTGEDPIFGAGLFRLGAASTAPVEANNASPPATELPRLENEVNTIWYAAGGVGTVFACGIFFLAWRRKKQQAAE